MFCSGAERFLTGGEGSGENEAGIGEENGELAAGVWRPYICHQIKYIYILYMYVHTC
jgi:hypothetical protein